MTFFFSKTRLDSSARVNNSSAIRDVEQHMREVEAHMRKVGAELEQRGRELEKRGRELEVKGRELEKSLFKDGGTYYSLEYSVGEDGRGAGYTKTSSATEVRAMHYFLIVYEPKGGGNPASLAKTLQKMEAWWNFVDRVWIIGTDETADALWKRLTGLFGKNDNVLVIELPSGPDRQGWLPEKAWDWFNKSMPRGKKQPSAPSKLSIPYSAFQDGGAVLVMPEGVRVHTKQDASGVYFTEEADAVPTPVPSPKAPSVPSLDGMFTSSRVSITETATLPPAVPTPPVPLGGTIQCTFCGNEAPADAWADGDCPRCGIKK